MLNVVDMILKRKLEHRAQLAAWYRVFTISNSRPLKTKIHPKLPFQISQDLVQIQIYKSNILEWFDDKTKKEFPYFTPILSFPPHFPTSGVISQNALKFHQFGPQNSFNGTSIISCTKSLEIVKMKMMVLLVLPATYSPLVAIVFMGLDHTTGR